MAVKLIEEEQPEPELVFWNMDGVTRVSFKIRAVPVTKDRRLRQRYVGNRKVGQSDRMPVSEEIEKRIDLTRERGAYVLVDSENFTVGVGDAAAAASLSALLKTDVKPGTEVCLDGKWTDDLREWVLTLLPKLAAWLSDQADKLIAQDAQEEDELGKT